MGLRNKAGQVYEGKTLRSSEPSVVRWPGTYGCNKDGTIDRDCPLEWDRKTKTWRRLR